MKLNHSVWGLTAEAARQCLWLHTLALAFQQRVSTVNSIALILYHTQAAAVSDLDSKLTGRVNSLQAALAVHDNTVSRLSGDINLSRSSAIASLTSSISRLQERLDAQGGKLQSLVEEIPNLNSNVTPQASATAAAADLTAVRSLVDAQQSGISDLRKQTSDLSNRVKNLSGMSGSHAADIRSLTMAFNSLQDSISNLMIAVESCTTPADARSELPQPIGSQSSIDDASWQMMGGDDQGATPSRATET
jgi:chromosome segregation ATPase